MTFKEKIMISAVIVIIILLAQIAIYSSIEDKTVINPSSTTDINNRTCPVRYELEYEDGELVKVVCERVSEF